MSQLREGRPAGPRQVRSAEIAWAVGALAHDKKLNLVGVVMDLLFGSVYLRPVGGDVEREAMPQDLEPPTLAADPAAELSARVAEANRRSRSRL